MYVRSRNNQIPVDIAAAQAALTTHSLKVSSYAALLPGLAAYFNADKQLMGWYGSRTWRSVRLHNFNRQRQKLVSVGCVLSRALLMCLLLYRRPWWAL